VLKDRQRKTDANASTQAVEMQSEDFVWHKLYEGDQSTLQRYLAMTLARPSLIKLLAYEFIVTFIAPIPGALGLVLRKVCYPLILGACGKGVVIGKSVTIRHPENVYLEDGVVIDDYALIDARGGGEAGVRLGNRVMINRGASVQAKVGAIIIGDESRIGAHSSIISQGPIEIGNKVSVAGGVTIAGGRYIVKADNQDPYAKRRESLGAIRIGDSSRLGMNVIVQDGVSVGKAAIVAPGSVVLNDVEDFEVVSGFPARPWRSRTENPHAEVIQPSSEPGYEGINSKKEGDKEPDSNIVNKIKHWLEETVFVEFGDSGLSECESLLDSNVLDSVGFVALSVWLEKTFNISISDDEIIPENMDSVDKLVAFVQKKLREAR